MRRSSIEARRIGLFAPEGRGAVATGGATSRSDERNPWSLDHEILNRPGRGGGDAVRAVRVDTIQPPVAPLGRKTKKQKHTPLFHGLRSRRSRFAPPVATFLRPSGAKTAESAASVLASRAKTMVIAGVVAFCIGESTAHAAWSSSAKWDSSYWPSDGSGIVTLLAVVSLIVGAVIGARAAWVMGRRVWQWSGPLRLFSRIAGEIGLSVADRWLLWRVARREGLTSPISLLLSEQTLTRHGERYITAAGGADAAYLRARVEEVRRRVFG